MHRRLIVWIAEAKWIGDQIKLIDLPNNEIECLNIGSSTRTYRESLKPYIQELIIKPISKRGKITHLDSKCDVGVDICGDISDAHFREFLEAKKYNLILCNNVLTHVREPCDIFEIIDKCLMKNGFVIISAPQQYPYCADPYDSKYRPSIWDIQKMLPNFETINYTKFESNETLKQRLSGDLNLFLGFVLNVLIPRHGFLVWKNIIADIPNLDKRFTSIGLVMKKII